jgi:hypothetical protein
MRAKAEIPEPDYALMLDDVEFEVSLAFNYPSLSAYSCYWLWRAVQFFFNQVNRFGSLAD